MKPALDIAVFDSDSLQGFQDTLEQALLILSQSDTGRQFGQTVIDADYTILVEDAAALPDGENASTDHAQKIIFLRKDNDPRRLALILGHEFCHVSQKNIGGIDLDVRGDHPLQSLRLFLMLEADARAHEMAIAIELDDMFPGTKKLAIDKTANPFVEKLFDRAEQAGNNDITALMAGCFKCFYTHDPLRKIYEDAVTHKIALLGKDAIQDAANLTSVTPLADIVQKFDSHGITYIGRHLNYLAFESPYMTAVRGDTAKRLDTIQTARRENPSVKNEALWYNHVAMLVKKPAAKPPAP